MFALHVGVPPGTILPRGVWSKTGFPKARTTVTRPPLEDGSSVNPDSVTGSGATSDAGNPSGAVSESKVWSGIEGRAAPEGCVREHGGLLRLKNRRKSRHVPTVLVLATLLGLVVGSGHAAPAISCTGADPPQNSQPRICRK